METIGVIVARLQTPCLQQKYFELIRSVKKKHHKVSVVLGMAAVKGSTIDPLDFETRKRMVQKDFPDILVLSLSDYRKEEVWSVKLDELLASSFPENKCILYGEDDRMISRYKGINAVERLSQASDSGASGVAEMNHALPGDTEDFRRGIIYAYRHLYPKIYATVDIALFRNNHDEILLGWRKTEKKWRLPGGFTDPVDENYEAAALRELQEECGALEVDLMQYEKSFKVDDWRYRREKDKIITSLFSTTLISGEPQGSDDIDDVKFVPLKSLEQMMKDGMITEEHVPLLAFLMAKYKKYD
jgi:bifunctional NMN adenylyltransferase/nudix hydrolase